MEDNMMELDEEVWTESHVCPVCQSESFSAYELCSHQLDLDDDLKAFLKEYSPKGSFAIPEGLKCEYCDLVCKNMKGLKQHIGKMHEVRRKHSQCPQCDKRFKNKYAVRFHMRQVHDKTTRVECPHCSKQLYNKYWLQEHLRSAHPGS